MSDDIIERAYDVDHVRDCMGYKSFGEWPCDCIIGDLAEEVEALRNVLRLFEVTHTTQDFGGEVAHMAFFAKDCALEITPDQAAAVLRALGQDNGSSEARS